MDKRDFEALISSVQDMGRHRRGQAVAGVVVREVPEPDVRAIRERTGLSQTRFAMLIGVSPKTLQNWEQKRVQPTGPARTLLRIVDAHPQALVALHT